MRGLTMSRVLDGEWFLLDCRAAICFQVCSGHSEAQDCSGRHHGALVRKQQAIPQASLQPASRVLCSLPDKITFEDVSTPAL